MLGAALLLLNLVFYGYVFSELVGQVVDWFFFNRLLPHVSIEMADIYVRIMEPLGG